MKKIIMTLLACTFLLSGCTQSNIVAKEGDREPDTEIRNDIEIAWNQVWDDLDSQFADPEVYPFSESVNCNVVDEEHRIDLVLLVQPGTTAEEAAPYATEVIKGFNDSISMQDFSYAASDDEYYGGFMDLYDVTVLIAPYDTKEVSSTWILQDTIKAGDDYREVGTAVAE